MTLSSAPPEIAYCAFCGATMITRQVGDKLRRACSECDYIHFTDPKVGVGVFVVEGDEVLLIRRTMNPERGKWSIPAGFVDAGEDPAQTAVREAQEETNLTVAITGLVDVYFNPPGQGGASIFILYTAQVVGGRTAAGKLAAGDDADAAGFFPVTALPPLAFASTIDAIRRWQAGKF